MGSECARQVGGVSARALAQIPRQRANKRFDLRALNVTVRLVAVVVVLAAAMKVRADSVPVGYSASTPNGYWSYQQYQPGDSGEHGALGFSGSGEMDMLVDTPSGWQPVDLTWSPEQFTLSGDYGPAMVSWTAVTGGTYTITTDGQLFVPNGGSSATPFASPDSDPGRMFSESITFQPGQTFSVMAMPIDAGSDSDFFYLGFSTPAPSGPMGIASLSLIGTALIVSGRMRRRRTCRCG